MTEFDEVCNISGLIIEPAPADIGCCIRCDVDISIPDCPELICAVCAEGER